MDRATDAGSAPDVPPRPLLADDQLPPRDVPLPWASVLLGLLVGALAGSHEFVARAFSGGDLLGSRSPAGPALGCAVVTAAGALALALADRLAWRWRRALRWPAFTLVSGVLAGVVLFWMGRLGLSWPLFATSSPSWLLGLAGIVALRCVLVALVLALACRPRRRMVWTALAVAVALEVFLFEAYVAARGLMTASWSSVSYELRGVVWTGWGRLCLAEWCPAAFAFAVAVALPLWRARRAAKIPAKDGKPLAWWWSNWKRRIALTLLVCLVAGYGLRLTGIGSRLMLHRAVIRRDTESVERLLAWGVDPDRLAAVDVDLPLHEAIINRGYADVVSVLLEGGADPDARASGISYTALYWAVGRPEITALLLEHGADANAPILGNTTPLHRASKGGAADVARMLLDAGADPNAQSDHGSTPLHRAAERGHEEVVRMLIEAGADLDVQDTRRGHSAVYLAADSGHGDVVQVLLDAGAEPNAQTAAGDAPLHRAARRGDADIAEKLMAAGALPSAVDVRGDSPLHEAASAGSGATIAVLLEAGADPNTSNANGEMALHTVASHTNAVAVRALIDAGGDVNARDIAGQTPLHRAAKSGAHSETTTRALLEAGADPEIRDLYRRTAHGAAKQAGNATCYETIEEHLADN